MLQNPPMPRNKVLLLMVAGAWIHVLYLLVDKRTWDMSLGSDKRVPSSTMLDISTGKEIAHGID